MVKTGRPIWLAEGAEKRAAVQAMFARIAPSYDRLNGLMSMARHHRWRTQAVALLQLSPGDVALDVCCGTGDFLIPLRRAVGPQGRLVGVDFCAPMLAQARDKDEAAALALGDAGHLPLPSGIFDAATVGWGLRNVPDIDAAHMEIARVLRPGGRFVSLDMALPRNPLVRAASRWMCQRILPLLGRVFGNAEAYAYLPESTERFWSREALADSMRRAGFCDITTHDLFFGNLCIHFGRKATPSS